MIVQGPGLDVVLRQLGGRQQLDGAGLQLHHLPGKQLQLEVHETHLQSEDHCFVTAVR